MKIEGDNLHVLNRSLSFYQHALEKERDNVFNQFRDPTEQLLKIESELQNIGKLRNAVLHNINQEMITADD